MNPGTLFLLVFGAMLTLSASWLMPRLETDPDRLSVAIDLIADGRASEAVHLMEDHVWRGVAEYRAERHRRATTEFIQDKSVLSTYNLGTAYARLGEWRAARAAFERVLRLDPAHQDAAYNLSLVLKAEEFEQQELEDQRETRTLGEQKAAAGLGEKADGANGEEGEGEEALPPQDLVASDKDSGLAGQSRGQGRSGDEANTKDAAAGRGDVAEADDQESTGQDGAGSMRRLTQSAQDAEILLRAIADDPERVLAARLRAIDRLRKEGGQ